MKSLGCVENIDNVCFDINFDNGCFDINIDNVCFDINLDNEKIHILGQSQWFSTFFPSWTPKVKKMVFVDPNTMQIDHLWTPKH